jgi:outer membrane lipoprotein
MDIRSIFPAGREVSGGYRRVWRWCGWLWMLSLCAGCAQSPIAETWRQVARNQPSFAEISANPEFFAGQTVILGGEVARANSQPPVTEIEVWQERLDSGDRPDEHPSLSQGRFLIRCPGFLSPADYAQGSPITVVGEVQGQALKDAEIRPLGPFRYAYPAIRYPVIGCRQIQVWPSRRKALEAYAAPYGVGPRWWRWPGYAYPYYYRPFR